MNPKFAQDALGREFPSEEHVLRRVQMWSQSQILVHDLDAQLGHLLRVRHLDLLALEEDIAFVESKVSRECLHHRRFTGAVVADQGDHLARVDVEVGVVQGPDVSETPGQSACFQNGGHRAVTSV